MRRGKLEMLAVAAAAAVTCDSAAGGAEGARAPAASALVVAWNARAYEIGFAEDGFRTFRTQRAYALMHLAMHDALNATKPRYRAYALRELDPRASPQAAAAQAAHDVLLSQYPGAAAVLAADLAAALASVPAGVSRQRGIALGQRAARAILALREGDGWNAEGSYTFQKGAGLYQSTPDWKGFVVQPGFALARPFGLASPAQLRPPPPPALTSAAYAAAFREVKEQGRAGSRLRTADQTGYAVWWMEFSEGSFARLARGLVVRQDVDVRDAARLFALLGMALFDTYVAVWDAKYFYNHWRPFTAIRGADRDGNPDTEADPGWEPLRPAPPFPEYVSAHAAGCAASAEILGQALGPVGPFIMTTTTAPAGMPSRRFESFAAAARECADSRVQLGFHFRYATDAGLALGRAVATHLLGHHLQPR